MATQLVLALDDLSDLPHGGLDLYEGTRNEEVLPPVSREECALGRPREDVLPQVYVLGQVPERVDAFVDHSKRDEPLHDLFKVERLVRVVDA